MNHEFDVLEKRIRCLESQNRRLKWIGIVFVALAMTSTVWAQKSGTVVTQAQKFELRDDAGHLRAELSMINGDPALRFFGEHEDGRSLLDGNSFTIFKKGGSETDILASFAYNEVRFEDGHDRPFVVLRVDEEGQTGKLQLNDYRHKVYVGVTPADLSKLRSDKAR